MGYYRGDYYRPRGDYYRPRGDVWGALTGAATGFLTGGFAGALKGGVIGAIGKKATPGGSLTAQGGRPGLMSPQGGIVIHPGNVLPGGAPFIEPVGGYARKYKKINPTNVKALRRAIRRQAGFMAIVKRTIKGTGMTLKRTGIPTKAKKRR